MKNTAATLSVAKITLDLDNPRLYHHRLSGDQPENESELENSISSDPQFKGLMKSIKKSGVTDPIWTIPQDNGFQLVIEGNRRVVALRKLIQSGIDPPEGVDYTRVLALVIDADTPPLDIKMHKAQLQTGKTAWGVFNEAALIHDFHENDFMALEDIATDMQKPINHVRKLLSAYAKFLEYSTTTGDTNPKRFAMFNEAPKAVQSWVEESQMNKKDYFEWVNPTKGKARIRSVATRGGLRDFAKVIEDPDAVEMLRNVKDATVEEALDVVKQNNVMRDMPFLKQILPLQAKMNGMSPAQKARLTSEPRIKIHLRSLRDACEALIHDLDAFDQ